MNKNKAVLFILLFLLWLCLTWSLSIERLIIGAVCAAVIALLSGSLADAFDIRLLSEPKRLLWLMAYFPVLVGDLLLSFLRMALLVIAPAPRLAPGTIRITTSLKSGMALAFLANALTLVSHAATVDLDRQAGLLYIHVMAVHDNADVEKHAAKYEKLLGKVFE
jgi:multicomponent Na+:H+ antiporter subunit E